jgi:hypothetical protein
MRCMLRLIRNGVFIGCYPYRILRKGNRVCAPSAGHLDDNLR